LDFLRKNRRHAHGRGFTLIELMVVVVIIAILAVIAVPGVVERMRERRSNQAAQEIASIYRTARMHALGRGSAVLVHYDATGGFQAEEAIVGTKGNASDCAWLPYSSCLTNSWDVATEYSVVDSFAINNEYVGAGVTASVNAPVGGAVTYLDVCFTPHGRSFSRLAAGAGLTQLTGVVTVNVNRGANSIQRTVTVPPSGIARVAAQ
jgi:prepilin-type N-terminal cleavage/methylation domain-containing protein